jgi:lysophospholipase L1-like esterase
MRYVLSTRQALASAGTALLCSVLLLGCADDDDDGWVDPDQSGVPILPLGDSITQGDAQHLSYRYFLWWMLLDEGYHFDFVGSKTGNHEGNPLWPDHEGQEFDRDHEGHWGWHADAILDRLPRWLEGYTPDIVLLQIGTNDVFWGQPPATIALEIGLIIETLRDHNPNVVVLLAKLPPLFDSAVMPAITQLNVLLEVTAAAADEPGSPVVIVDQNTGFDVDADTYDGVHPNAHGEAKMAERWLEGLAPFL